MLARTTGRTANSLAYELEEVSEQRCQTPKRILERLGKHGQKSDGHVSRKHLDQKLCAAVERKKLWTAIRADRAREQVEKAKEIHSLNKNPKSSMKGTH